MVDYNSFQWVFQVFIPSFENLITHIALDENPGSPGGCNAGGGLGGGLGGDSECEEGEGILFIFIPKIQWK